MSKIVTLNRITLCASDGSIGVQLMKQLIDGDTGAVEAQQPHMISIQPNEDMAVAGAIIDGNVASLLRDYGYSTSQDEEFRIKSFVSAIYALAKADPVVSANRAAWIADQKARQEAAAAEANG